MVSEKIEHPLYVRIMDALPVAPGTDDAVYRDVLRGAVELHRPIPETAPYGTIFWHCEGCDPGDYSEGPPDAPCTTLAGIGVALGIEP